MKYYFLGNSGLRVSELSLGAMTFGTDWGWGAAPDEARKMLDIYLEHGGNFVDTASGYTNGSSEKFWATFSASVVSASFWLRNTLSTFILAIPMLAATTA